MNENCLLICVTNLKKALKSDDKEDLIFDYHYGNRCISCIGFSVVGRGVHRHVVHRTAWERERERERERKWEWESSQREVIDRSAKFRSQSSTFALYPSALKPRPLFRACIIHIPRWCVDRPARLLAVSESSIRCWVPPEVPRGVRISVSSLSDRHSYPQTPPHFTLLPIASIKSMLFFSLPALYLKRNKLHRSSDL